MKKLIFVLAIALLAIGTVSAQSVTVSGTLQLQNGSIAVASGSNVYFVPVLNQYIGFIDGLREGAQVSINGTVWGNSIQPITVTIAGKTYDFTPNNQQGFNQGNFSNYGGYGYGPCCIGWGGNVSANRMGGRWGRW
jgi:FlaG/FlaF family flagellin (archaellin)